jgi:T4-like virus Myoviridae tail sheath stabiliser
MDYFYSQQLRSYRLQIMRAFSNFYVSFGTNSDGTLNLKRVPCRWGDSSRLAETLIAAGSENKMPNVPFISVYISSFSMAPQRRQNPTMTSTVSITERAYNSEDGRYLDTPGNSYSVTRYMPVPYDLTVMVDFWTSNLDQKEQLLEQVLVLFNGMIDIQTSVNGIDWSSMTVIEHTNITWSSRTIPIGTENPIDVASLEFKVPIWISPPAKVQYQKLIQQIITSINDGSYDPVSDQWDTVSLLSTDITTPDNARIGVSLVGENLYDIQLQNDAGSNIDTRGVATRVQGISFPELIPGASFRFNGYSITIPNNNINDLINVIKTQIQDTHLNVLLNLRGTLEFWNHSGGDIVLENITSTPVNSLGFQSAVYKGGTIPWWRLLESYNIAKLYDPSQNSSLLKQKNQLLLMPSAEATGYDGAIFGSITPHPSDLNKLRWSPDMSTWPKATLPAVTAIIDPHKSFPGNGLSGPPQPGDRYLLIEELNGANIAWGAVVAHINDIIEWNGATWMVSFDAAKHENTTQYIQNKFSKKWLNFSSGEWNVFPKNTYHQGEWRLKI